MWVILSVFLETFVFCITKLNDGPGHFTQNWLIIDEFSIKKTPVNSFPFYSYPDPHVINLLLCLSI